MKKSLSKAIILTLGLSLCTSSFAFLLYVPYGFAVARFASCPVAGELVKGPLKRESAKRLDHGKDKKGRHFWKIKSAQYASDKSKHQWENIVLIKARNAEQAFEIASDAVAHSHGKAKVRIIRGRKTCVYKLKSEKGSTIGWLGARPVRLK